MQFTLNAQKRSEIKNQVKKLRKDVKIPAVLYGHGFANQNLTLDYVQFEKIYHGAGTSNLIDLVIDSGQPIKVLIQDFSQNPVTDRIAHVDFRQVKMTEKLKTDIKLNFVGESPAVKGLGGTFVKSFSEVPVECLPQDLVGEITVDISSLKNFGDALHVGDLIAPPGIKILAHAEDVIANVAAPKVEEEAPVAPAADLTQIKTEAEVKKEKKAVEEGEAATADAKAKEAPAKK